MDELKELLEAIIRSNTAELEKLVRSKCSPEVVGGVFVWDKTSCVRALAQLMVSMVSQGRVGEDV